MAELDAAVAQLLPALNERAFKKLPGNRCEAFARLDAPYLRPLPATRFVLAEWKRATVNIDYHVESDSHYYSVPHALVRQEVELRITRSTIEILARGRRVTSHPRSYRKGQLSTMTQHIRQPRTGHTLSGRPAN